MEREQVGGRISASKELVKSVEVMRQQVRAEDNEERSVEIVNIYYVILHVR
jgi:hypothetical protein